ncbi:MAG TPA: hypothetical protein PLF88_08745 [Opitutaceae bacterium]|nr:hypothetical protein [Opitutaceae bacterium]HRJ48140.1 hypothetical protein [Opitutaceae bacterium]
MPLTASRNTEERPGEIQHIPLAADTVVFQGGLTARNGDGRAVPAADAAGLKVIGRAEQTVDNSDGEAGALAVNAKRGVFLFANSDDEPITAAHVGGYAFVEDDETVASDSDHKVKAGRIVDVEERGVWVDTRDTGDVPSADTLTALNFTGGGATGPEVEAFRNAVLAILQAGNLVK